MTLQMRGQGVERAFHLRLVGGVGEASGARVGFLAQSPNGPGCTAVVDNITYTPGAPPDLRDGS